jgi:hypothetical protein
MEFIAGGTNCAAQMKAAIEQGCGLALGAFVGFFFADQELDLASHETADGGGTSSGDNLCLLNGLAVEANGQILFSVGLCIGHGRPRSRALRAARILRVAYVLQGVNRRLRGTRGSLRVRGDASGAGR